MRKKMDEQYQHYDNKKGGGQKYLRKGGIDAVMGNKEEKGKKEGRGRGGEGGGGSGGQDREARWVLQDPEVENFILLFVWSSWMLHN